MDAIVDTVVNDIYAKYNLKQDGLMTKGEAMMFVRDFYGRKFRDMSFETQNNCFKDFDQNESGYIEHSEFVAYVKKVCFEEC